MIIKRVVRNTENGDYEALLALTEEQTAFLINLAIGVLVEKGTLSFVDIKEGDPSLVKEAATDFLENIDKDILHKA